MWDCIALALMRLSRPNINLLLELLALGLAIVTLAQFRALEKMAQFRFGAHVDAVSLLFALSLLVGLLGLVLPQQPGGSKTLTRVVFVITLGTVLFVPALLHWR